MRIGFQFVLYIIILNLVSGLVYSLNVPGVEYTTPPIGTGNATDYEEKFNPEFLILGISMAPLLAIPFVGHFLAFALIVWSAVSFIVMGFPQMLEGYASFIGDPVAQTALTGVCWVLRGVFSFIIFMWLYQLITGRTVED